MLGKLTDEQRARVVSYVLATYSYAGGRDVEIDKDGRLSIWLERPRTSKPRRIAAGWGAQLLRDATAKTPVSW